MMKSLRATTILAAAAFALCQSAYANHLDERPSYFVEWIEGNGYQQLDTEYVFKVSPRVEARVEITSNARYYRFVAGNAVSGSPYFTVNYCVADLKGVQHTYYANETYKGGLSSYGFNTNVWFDATWGSVYKHNGTTLKSYPLCDFSANTQTFCLFRRNGSDAGVMGLRIGRVQMYDGASLVRDLWPAVTSGGEACMYDSVTDKCYIGIRTGNPFTAGPQCAGCDYSSVTPVTWSNLSGGRFDAGANWSGGAAPQSGETAAFADSGTYAVTFPEAVALATPVLVAKPSGTMTFDTTGASWTLPAATYPASPSPYPFLLRNSLAGDAPRSAFHVVQGTNVNGILKSENGVFRFSAGDSPSLTFASGAINFHDPDGTAPPALNTVYPGYEAPLSMEFAGGTSRLPNVRLEAGKGRADGTTLRYSGGTHDVFGTITVKNRMALGKEIAFEVTGQGTRVNLLGGYDGYPSGNSSEEGDYKAFHSDAIRVTDGATLTVTGTCFRTQASDFKFLVDHATVNIDSDYFMLGSPYNVSGYPGGGSKVYNTNLVVLSDAAITLGPSVKANWIGSYDPWKTTRSYTKWYATNTVFDTSCTFRPWAGNFLFKNCVVNFRQGVTCMYHRSDPVIDGGAVTSLYWRINADRSKNFTNTLNIVAGDHSFGELTLSGNDQGANAPGILNLSGGKLTVTTTFNLTGNGSAGSVLNLTGGELNALVAPTLSGNDKINLLGGVWRVPSIPAGNVRNIFCDGATIQATGASASFFANNTKASSSLLLGPDGLRIFSDYAITVAAVFHDDPGADGLLVKDGIGTLTLSGASDHARTIVTNGTLQYAAAVTAQRAVEVVNGARLDLSGANGKPSFTSLTLGDASSRAELVIDNATTLSVTNFNPVSVKLALTSPAADGTYGLVSATGDQTARLATWRGTFADLPLGKQYVYGATYDTNADTTLFTVTVQDMVAASSDVHWTGAVDDAWSVDGNWDPAAVPAADTTAHFDSESAPNDVVVASAATAAGLDFSAAQGYTLSGSGPITLADGYAGFIVSSNGSHKVNVPVVAASVLPVTVEAGASVELAKPVTGPLGGLAKDGPGTLILSATNNLAYDMVHSGGTLELRDAAAASGQSFRLGSTLSYPDDATGGGEVTVPTVLETATTAGSVTILNEGDLSFANWTSTRGAILKRGDGRLSFHLAHGTILMSDSSSKAGSLRVSEGEVAACVPTDATAYGYGPIQVGANAADAGERARLVMTGGGRYSGSSGEFKVGVDNITGAPALEEAAAVFTDMTSVSVGGTTIGGSSSYGLAGLYVTNVASFSVGGNFTPKTSRLGPSRIMLKNSTLSLNGAFYPAGRFDLEADNSRVVSGGRCIYTPTAGGTIVLRNGSYWKHGGNIEYTGGQGNYPGTRWTFDGATYETAPADAYWQAYNSAGVSYTIAPGGLSFLVPSGKKFRLLLPLDGPGRLTLTGSGTFRLERAKGWGKSGSATNLADSVTMKWTGGTYVAAGTLAITNGAAPATARLAFAQDTVLDLCDPACSQTYAEIVGGVTVKNGTLSTPTLIVSNGCHMAFTDGGRFAGGSFTYVYPVSGLADFGSRIDFGDSTLAPGRVLVDLVNGGIGEPADLAANTNVVIATYSGATPDVSGWRVIRSDGPRVYSYVSAGNGEIRLTLFKLPPATFILLR